MPAVEVALFCVTVALYFLGLCLYVFSLLFKKEIWLRWGTVFAGCGLIFHTIALGFRWYASGHFPGNNLYELNSMGSWFAIFLFLILQYEFREARILGVVILPISLLVMSYGVMSAPEMGPLLAEYQNPWFIVHILFAWFAYACYVVACGCAVFYLLKEKYFVGDSPESFYGRLPSLLTLDELSFRSIAFGFVTHSAMIVSGSIWANTAWGSYWNWDPVETWSLVSWLIYGVYIHLRLTFRWKEKKAAWLAILALIAVVFSYWGVPHLPSKSYIHV